MRTQAFASNKPLHYILGHGDSKHTYTKNTHILILFTMINNAFGDAQCILCYKILKQCRGYAFRRHYCSYHSDMDNFKDGEKRFIWKNWKSGYLKKKTTKKKL